MANPIAPSPTAAAASPALPPPVPETLATTAAQKALKDKEAVEKKLQGARSSVFTVLKRVIPNFPEGAAQFFTVGDGLNLAAPTLALRVEEEGGEITPTALRNFYRANYWIINEYRKTYSNALSGLEHIPELLSVPNWHANDLSNYETTIENFWKDCSVPESNLKSLRVLQRALMVSEEVTKHPLRPQAIATSDETQSLLKIMADKIVTLWLKVSASSEAMRKDLISVYEIGSANLNRVKLARMESRREGARKSGSLGKSYVGFWEIINRLLKQCPFHIERCMPHMAYSLALGQKQFTNELYAQCKRYENYAQSFISLIVNLANEVSLKEAGTCLTYGTLPRSVHAKNHVKTYIFSSFKSQLTFIMRVGHNCENINVWLRNVIGSLRSRRNPQNQLTDEEQALFEKEHKYFKSNLDEILQCFSDPEEALIFEETAYEKLIKRLEEIEKKVKNYADFKGEVRKIIAQNFVVTEQLKTDAGLKGFLDTTKKISQASIAIVERKTRLHLNSFEENQDVVDQLQKVGAVLWSNCHLIRHTSEFLATLSNTYERITKVAHAQLTVAADAQLFLLEAEENAAASKTAYEAMQQKEKHVASTAAISEAPVAESAAAVVIREPEPLPVMFESVFNHETSHVLFQLQALVSQYQKMRPTPSAFRCYDLQRDNAMECLESALEIHECVLPGDKRFAMQWVLLFGFLSLEQAASAQFVQNQPAHLLRHDLAMLLNGIGINMDSNWFGMNSVYYRYPWNFSAVGAHPLPLALRIMQEGNQKDVETFDKDKRKWISEFLNVSVVVLPPAATTQEKSLVSRIQGIVTGFSKQEATAKKREREETAALPMRFQTLLKQSEERLRAASLLLQQRLKGESDQISAKALHNASHHLDNLRCSITVLSRFPQQRFLHLHLHVQVIAIQYFVENLGCFLSGLSTHSLEYYAKEFGLGNGIENEELLKVIDIAKGSEYIYSHSGRLIEELKRLQAYAKAARLLGEGAIPAGESERKQVVEELQDRVIGWSSQFAALAHALCRKHLVHEE